MYSTKTKKILISTFLAVQFLFFTVLIDAKEPIANSIKTKAAYVYASLPGSKTTALYLTFKNKSKKDVKITNVSTPVASESEIHESIHQNWMIRMVHLKDFTIHAGETSVFEPGKLHIMLIDLKKKLTSGEKIKVTFTFNDGSTLTIFVPVVDRKKHP